MKFEGFTNISASLRAGVYILVAKGQVIYIGKSKLMLGRVYAHRDIWAKKRKGQKVPDYLPPGLLYDEVHVLPCLAADLDRVEAEMIDLYRPKFNTQLKRQGLPIRAPFTIQIGEVALVLNAPPTPAPRLERRL